MSVRANIGLLPHPLKWFTTHPSVGSMVFAAIGMWLLGRRSRLNVPPVSSEWLLDYDRRSHGQY
jgi:hypothetical protein